MLFSCVSPSPSASPSAEYYILLSPASGEWVFRLKFLKPINDMFLNMNNFIMTKRLEHIIMLMYFSILLIVLREEVLSHIDLITVYR